MKRRETEAARQLRNATEEVTAARLRATHDISDANERIRIATERARVAEAEAETAELRPFMVYLDQVAPGPLFEHLQVNDKYRSRRLAAVIEKATDATTKENDRIVLYRVLMGRTSDPRWFTEIISLVETFADNPGAMDEVSVGYATSTRFGQLLNAVTAFTWSLKDGKELTSRFVKLAENRSGAKQAETLRGAACLVRVSGSPGTDLRAHLVEKWGDVNKYLDVVQVARDAFLKRRDYATESDDETCLSDMFGPRAVFVGSVFARQPNVRTLHVNNVTALQGRITSFYGPGSRPIVSDAPEAWRQWLTANQKYVDLWMEEDLRSLRNRPELLNEAVSTQSWPRRGIPVLSGGQF
jgi:hypothetical protein